MTIPENTELTPGTLNKRQNDLHSTTTLGTSDQEIGNAMRDAMAQARKDFPNEPEGSEKVKQRAGQYMGKYFQRIAAPYAAKEIGDQGGKTLGKLIDNIRENANKSGANQVELMNQAYLALLALEKKSGDDFVDRWNSTQKDGLEAMKAPYNIQASLGGFMSGLGAIISLFPEHAEMGKALMDRGTKLSLDAGQKIMDLNAKVALMPHSELEKIKLSKGYLPTDISNAQRDLLRTLDPGVIRRGMDGAYGAADGAATGRTVAGRGGGSFVLGAYNEAGLNGKVAAMNRDSPYDAEMKVAAAQYGIDWRELKLRMVVESGGQAFEKDGKTPLTSPQGALGLMQFMPDTAKSYGINPADPKQSIHGAAQLIAESLRKHGGRTDLLDSEYYGGADRAAWGPNTQQYVANLKRLRKATLGQEVVTYDTSKITVAKASETSKVAAATAETPAVVARADEAARTTEAVAAKAINKAAGKTLTTVASVQPPFEQAAARDQAPKTAKGDIKGLRQTAAALSMDGEAGSFAEGQKKQLHVSIAPLPALTLDMKS